MLVLNYLHQGGTNPSLNARTASPPLLGSTTLGTDESVSSTTWGHTAPSLLRNFAVDELRFSCSTSGHSRVLDFASDDLSCVEYFKTGFGSCPALGASLQPLNGHGASLPIVADVRSSNQGNQAMSEFPFYRASLYHWGIRGSGSRWECDDFPNNSSRNTHHRIYIRRRTNSSQVTRISCAAHYAAGNVTSGMYMVDPDLDGPEAALPVYCDMSEGGGWMLVANYLHAGGTSPSVSVWSGKLPAVFNTSLGVDESGGSGTWGHSAPAFLNLFSPSELRFRCQTSGHSRVVHFRTANANCINYFRTGTGSCSGVNSGFTPLTGHTGNMPGSTPAVYSNQGENAMTVFPFYQGGSSHWAITGGSNRWECDDYPNNSANNTLHQIWVR